MGDRETTLLESTVFMPTPWSVLIADRYRCELSAQLADWFDAGLWEKTGHGEFRESVDPERLLGEAPEVIWPGLMTCDLLPIVGNTAGDWICVRIDEQNVAAEMVHWYHGGGDWIPWGSQLAEAIAFDHLVDLLPGPSLRHAVPAENPRPGQSKTTQAKTGRSGSIESDGVQPNPVECPYLNWAWDHLPSPVVDLCSASQTELGREQLANWLLENHIAESAVRCEMISHHLLALSEPLEKLLKDTRDITADHVTQWRFDVGRVPEIHRAKLEQGVGKSLSELQNWDAAEEHAKIVTQTQPNLAWAWDILGYAAERRGDVDAAKSVYMRGARCSLFSDQSVRLKTHLMAGQSLKFSASRLAGLAPDFVRDDPYLALLCSGEGDPHQSVTEHWMRLGSQFRAAEKYSDCS